METILSATAAVFLVTAAVADEVRPSQRREQQAEASGRLFEASVAAFLPDLPPLRRQEDCRAGRDH
jgi:hypothetical protein